MNGRRVKQLRKASTEVVGVDSEGNDILGVSRPHPGRKFGGKPNIVWVLNQAKRNWAIGRKAE